MSLTAGKLRTTDPVIHHFKPRTRTARRPAILVVEDHDDTREMLHVLLEAWGYRVLEAGNGVEAVEVAARERPPLILMDGSLPLLDGLSATRRIRENPLLDGVKVLAMNGWGTKAYHAAALAAGCSDCIAKPFNFEELRNSLSSMLPLMVPRQTDNVLQAAFAPKISPTGL